MNITSQGRVNTKTSEIMFSGNQVHSFNHLKDEKINDKVNDDNESANAMSRNQPFMPTVKAKLLQNHGLIVDIYGSFRNGKFIF